ARTTQGYLWRGGPDTRLRRHQRGPPIRQTLRVSGVPQPGERTGDRFWRRLDRRGALPDVRPRQRLGQPETRRGPTASAERLELQRRDRKSTRLNSSHVAISYADFCL